MVRAPLGETAAPALALRVVWRRVDVARATLPPWRRDPGGLLARAGGYNAPAPHPGPFGPLIPPPPLYVVLCQFLTGVFLLGPLLKGVSRSFYLTLRILPAGMRDPVGLAYLLARAAGTIADTGADSPAAAAGAAAGAARPRERCR